MDCKPLNNKNKVHAQLQLLATDNGHQSFYVSKSTACLLLVSVTALSYLKPHDRMFPLMTAEEIWVSHPTPNCETKRGVQVPLKIIIHITAGIVSSRYTSSHAVEIFFPMNSKAAECCVD